MELFRGLSCTLPGRYIFSFCKIEFYCNEKDFVMKGRDTNKSIRECWAEKNIMSYRCIYLHLDIPNYLLTQIRKDKLDLCTPKGKWREMQINIRKFQSATTPNLYTTDITLWSYNVLITFEDSELSKLKVWSSPTEWIYQKGQLTWSTQFHGFSVSFKTYKIQWYDQVLSGPHHKPPHFCD